MRVFLPLRPAFETLRDCFEGCLLVLVDGVFERANESAIALAHDLKHGDGGAASWRREEQSREGRNEARKRLRRALDEFIVDGINRTIPLFQTLVRTADIHNGLNDIHRLESFLAAGGMDEADAWVSP